MRPVAGSLMPYLFKGITFMSCHFKGDEGQHRLSFGRKFFKFCLEIRYSLNYFCSVVI